MRCALGLFLLLFLAGSAAAAAGLAVPQSETQSIPSKDAVVPWIYGYRLKPEPTRLPAAVKMLSKSEAFKDPESSGIFVGFIAGVLGANPARAEALLDKVLPLPAADQWVIVRAIAYSGLPNWKDLMARMSPQLAGRQPMIDSYLTGKLPSLDHVKLDSDPTLLDTLWGVYYATGSYIPIARLITTLEWSKDGNSEERLTIGSMAKFTLAYNATRDMKLLNMMRRTVDVQPKKVKPILKEVIEAAETANSGKIRKAALAAIEARKRKGPDYKRELNTWGQVGVGAIAVGCVVAAVLGQVALGIPCVVGGATTEAALRWWQSKD